MIRCLRFRPCAKNTLRGFADLELTRVGLVIRDCPVHEKNGRSWVAFPARPWIDRDGNTQWQCLVEFSAGAAREQFQQQALAAIRETAAEEMVA
jgi:hypothetical protein